ncbi:MAG: glycoside hydrolase family 31 protein, partial [bacterium]|nr:glycoside hydrolase family 31 protein [bacterium]
FTVLTPRLLRLEYSETGEFVDQPTQVVTNREFPLPEFTHETLEDGTLQITTDFLRLRYDSRPFSPGGLSVTLLRGATDNHYSTWRYATDIPQHLPWHGNYGGTARTLDDADGRVPLTPGLFATYGFSVLDDSTSVLLSDDGWVTPRPSLTSQDLYLFGYGQDFRAGLADYHRLTGATPLLPRYALGNWWSRYWPYSDEEYLELMDRFAADEVPFSVAVLDMDWHIVDVDPEIGTGWTGYTWNPDLFPDPRSFLSRLRERGLAVNLNVHPADGVRRHEEYYAEMADALGFDPELGHPIEFDITDRAFVDAYLKYLHHPREEEGVDFWWPDWQSGSVSRIPGLDPLWMLNHIHFTDSGRSGHRPMTLSRYAGPGSHRYPVGFSGDTVISWESLDFQPEFTASAANIGYPWWSHDVGGHMFGERSDEMAVRWYQLGVFSPLNRLHSTSGPFATKEPWTYGPLAERIMGQYLRLRHRLVPYTYTANWSTHLEHTALVRPMYHEHPHTKAAYAVPNQAMFGPDLLLAPITSPSAGGTHLARVVAWLPPGSWFDLFTGHRYSSPDGGTHLPLHRRLGHYPVLVRAGAVLPLAGDPMADVRANPSALEFRVFPGTGTSRLSEDDLPDAVPSPEERRTWEIHQRLHIDDDGRATLVLTLAAPTGPRAEGTRQVTVDVVGVESVERAVLAVGGETVAEHQGEVLSDELLAPALRFELGEVDLNEGFELRLEGAVATQPDRRAEQLALIQLGETAYAAKDAAWAAVNSVGGAGLGVAQALQAAAIPEMLRGALLEVQSVDAAW